MSRYLVQAVLVVVGIAFLASFYGLRPVPSSGSPPTSSGPPPSPAASSPPRPPAQKGPPSQGPAPRIDADSVLIMVDVAVDGEKPVFLQEVKAAPGVTLKLYQYPGLEYEIVTDRGSVRQAVAIGEDGRMQQTVKLGTRTIKEIRFERAGLQTIRFEWPTVSGDGVLLLPSVTLKS